MSAFFGMNKIFFNSFALANTFILHYAFCILHFVRQHDKLEYEMQQTVDDGAHLG